MRKNMKQAIGTGAAAITMLGLLQGTGLAQADTTTAAQTTSTTSSTQTAAKVAHVTVRVEGYGNLHFARQVAVTAGTYKETDGSSLPLDKPTVLGALLTALENTNQSYEVKPNQWGPYLTGVSGEKEKDLKDANTGWSFWLNGQPLQVGADQQTIQDGDTIVCGFYDYTKTLYPTVKLSTNSVKIGSDVTVTVSAMKTTYDADFNPTTTEVKIKGATVHFGNQIVVTDENGQATFTPKTEGNLLVYVDQYQPDGLPLLVPTAVQTLHVQEQANAAFTDTNQVAWAASAIQDLATKSVVLGDGTGQFKPNQSITRAELAAMSVVATGVQASGAPISFTDTTRNAWYSPYIQVAVANGLLLGDSSHRMHPNEGVTREELAAILVHAAGLDQEAKTIQTQGLAVTFHDAASVQTWAKPFVAVAIAHHFMNGEGNTFAPTRTATRAEAAVAIDHLIQSIGK